MRPEGVNPCQHVRKYPEHKPGAVSLRSRVRRLGVALRDEEEEGFVSPVAIAATRLLMLTGCRSGEIMGLRRDNVDPEAGELRFPESKTEAKVVHLATQRLRCCGASLA